jgi:hypothetical protein
MGIDAILLMLTMMGVARPEGVEPPAYWFEASGRNLAKPISVNAFPAADGGGSAAKVSHETVALLPRQLLADAKACALAVYEAGRPVGIRGGEAAAVVFSDGTCGKVTRSFGHGFMSDAVRVRFEDGMVAIFHTHPPNRRQLPSPGDAEVAARQKVLIFTVQPDSAWVVDPLGHIEQVADEGWRNASVADLPGDR